MEECPKNENEQKEKKQVIVGEGVKFEHYQRACCRIVGDPKTFPKGLREEVLDRVKHM